jgi:hypothetical protein
MHNGAVLGTGKDLRGQCYCARHGKDWPLGSVVGVGFHYLMLPLHFVVGGMPCTWLSSLDCGCLCATEATFRGGVLAASSLRFGVVGSHLVCR